jgi:hypothetical protein
MVQVVVLRRNGMVEAMAKKKREDDENINAARGKV